MKQKKLKIQEILTLGQQLFDTRNSLRDYCCLLSGHYSKDSDLVKLSLKLFQAANSLTSKLDDCLFRDYPELPPEACQIFYPGNKDNFSSSNHQFVLIQAKELLHVIEGNVDIAVMLGEEQDEAIHQVLLDAFKQYKVDVVREAYKLYTAKEKECTSAAGK